MSVVNKLGKKWTMVTGHLDTNQQPEKECASESTPPICARLMKLNQGGWGCYQSNN